MIKKKYSLFVSCLICSLVFIQNNVSAFPVKKDFGEVIDMIHVLIYAKTIGINLIMQVWFQENTLQMHCLVQ